MAITLNSLRDRVRTQLENAYGFPDPLQVATSAETLTTLRARVETMLQDAGNANFSTTTINEAIEKALEEYNRHNPALAVTTVTLAADGREVDISSISNLIRVYKVWWPYDSTDPGFPPNWVQFDVYPGQILFINERTEPSSGEKVRIWYLTPCTISGLNAASSTTVPDNDITYILNGACYYAGRSAAIAALMHPPDLPAPAAETASSETLTTLRDRVETMLQDSTNATWATGDIDEAIEKALEEYNRHWPSLEIHDHTVTTAGREQTVSITNLLAVKAVWFPYTAASLEHPPEWVAFQQLPDSKILLDVATAPAVDDHIRIWYTTPCTISGLNAAGSTTVPLHHMDALLNGAAAYAARERAVEIAEALTVDDDTAQRLTDYAGEQHKLFTAALEKPPAPEPLSSAQLEKLHAWTDEHGQTFRYGLRQDAPAWQRYAYAYHQGDIDEGIRWALGKFNEIAPQETITSIELSSDGREISLSSISDLLRVTRVWWPYTSTAPEFPPAWVSYEVWGTTLFIDSPSEPQSGDVVRVWYVRLCTINGLDSAEATTLPADAETLIITGAVGYVTEERIMEKPGWRVPRDLKEWAVTRLKEFHKGLVDYARRTSAGWAGLHELPALDRWDKDDTQW